MNYVQRISNIDVAVVVHNSQRIPLPESFSNCASFVLPFFFNLSAFKNNRMVWRFVCLCTCKMQANHGTKNVPACNLACAHVCTLSTQICMEQIKQWSIILSRNQHLLAFTAKTHSIKYVNRGCRSEAMHNKCQRYWTSRKRPCLVTVCTVIKL